MSKYFFNVYGECRKVGALGVFQRFQVRVIATDADAAFEKARAEQYEAGYEHVHCMAARRTGEIGEAR